jgi:hypothetical protein
LYKVSRDEPLCKICKTKHVNAVHTGEQCEIDRDQTESKYAFAIGDVTTGRVKVHVGGVPLHMLVDSGASVNVIDKETWTGLKSQDVICISSTAKPDKSLYAYGCTEPLKTIGTFTSEVSIGEQKCKADFIVIESEGIPLLGLNTATQLQLLKICGHANTIDVDNTANTIDVDNTVNAIDVDNTANTIDVNRRANSIDVDNTGNSPAKEREPVEKLEIAGLTVNRQTRELNLIREKRELNLMREQREVNPIREQHELNLTTEKRELKPTHEQRELNPTREQRELNATRQQRELNLTPEKREFNPTREQRELNLTREDGGRETDPVDDVTLDADLEHETNAADDVTLDADLEHETNSADDVTLDANVECIETGDWGDSEIRYNVRQRHIDKLTKQ